MKKHRGSSGPVPHDGPDQNPYPIGQGHFSPNNVGHLVLALFDVRTTGWPLFEFRSGPF